MNYTIFTRKNRWMTSKMKMLCTISSIEFLILEYWQLELPSLYHSSASWWIRCLFGMTISRLSATFCLLRYTEFSLPGIPHLILDENCLIIILDFYYQDYKLTLELKRKQVKCLVNISDVRWKSYDVIAN